MATILERVVNSVKHIFFLYFPFSYIGFEGGTLFLIASVPGHCLGFTF